MAEGAKAAFEAGLAAVSIGRRIGDAEVAYRDCLNERDLGDCCPMRFGVGISAAYPPVWENQITIQYETEDRFEQGMAFYIHASMQSMSDREGMLLGGSFLMTEAGPERLDRARMELVVDAQKNGPIYAQGSGPMKCAEEVKLLSGKRAVKRLSCC